jgi:hypothetical protein
VQSSWLSFWPYNLPPRVFPGEELQNLRSQMRCILLVSHQEDFAEAFSDGYQFKLEDGATKVTRFQR